MATNELAQKLARRDAINEGQEVAPNKNGPWNPYTEFKEFSRKQIKEYESMFKKYDIGNDKFIDLMELKLMMEKLGAPQTHMSLKGMIHEVDEDLDSKINFREFLLIFRKAAAGELDAGSGLCELAKLTEINVDESGVSGAKDFFQAKINQISDSGKFEKEIREEQEERKREQEESRLRKQAFKEKQNAFKVQ